MRSNILALVLAEGCGDLPPMAIDGGDGSSDAAPTPLTPLPVNCVDYKRTITAADGSWIERTGRYASFPQISEGDDFVVKLCDLVSTSPSPTCDAGTTCTGADQPTGPTCYVSRGTGTVYAGTLTVSCGYKYSSYAAGGALIETSGYSYTSITVLH